MMKDWGYEAVPAGSAHEDPCPDAEDPCSDPDNELLTCRDSIRDSAREIGTPTHPWTCRSLISRLGVGGLMGASVLTWAVVAFVSFYGSSFQSTSFQKSSGGSSGVLDSVEFDEVLRTQARSLLDVPEAKTKNVNAEHIDAAIKKVHKFFDQHFTKSQKMKLARHPFPATFWSDLKTLPGILKDRRVRNVGSTVLHEVRRNLLAGPAEVGKKVMAQLQRDSLQDLAHEVLPYRLREKLGKWDQEASGEHAWHAMLDPTGELFPRLRHNSTDLQFGKTTMSLQIGEHRRLFDEDTTFLRLDHPAEFAEGIVSTVAVSAAVIVLNIDLLSKLEFPKWVHGMLFLNAAAFGGLSCTFGLTLWCDMFVGGLGLLALEAGVASVHQIELPTQIQSVT